MPRLNAIPGVRVFMQIPPSLPVPGGGLPVQFVVASVAEHRALAEVGQEMLGKAMASGNFMFLDTDLKFDTPRLQLLVDRAKAARLGIPMQEIGGTLATLLGGNYVSRFNLQGRAYKVIPQVKQDFRLSADGTPYFLEANPNPEIARYEVFAEAAAYDGMKYSEMLRRIIALGIQRARAKAR